MDETYVTALLSLTGALLVSIINAIGVARKSHFESIQKQVEILQRTVEILQSENKRIFDERNHPKSIDRLPPQNDNGRYKTRTLVKVMIIKHVIIKKNSPDLELQKRIKHFKSTSRPSKKFKQRTNVT